MHQRKKKNFSYQTKCTSRKQTKAFIVQISEYPFQVLHLQKALVPEDDQGIKRAQRKSKSRWDSWKSEEQQKA